LAALDPLVEFACPYGPRASSREDTMKGSGVPLAQTTFCLYSLREGRVVRIEVFHTQKAAFESAGLSE
jgi:hypothetical protein